MVAIVAEAGDARDLQDQRRDHKEIGFEHIVRADARLIHPQNMPPLSVT
jgi:hypothetical protein